MFKRENLFSESGMKLATHGTAVLEQYLDLKGLKLEIGPMGIP